MLIVDFDPAKDAINQLKHGLPLGLALELDWDVALVWLDERVDYGERRMAALVPRDGRIHFVAYVERGDVRRIISLRPANRREVRHYEESNHTDEDPHADRRRGPPDHGGGPE